MLDIMRQKKRMKAVVLWVVIIAVGLSMVVWGVALNLGGSGSSPSGAYAATIDGHSIPMMDFLETYRRTIRNLRNNTELDSEQLKSLGISQQILNSLIQEKVIEILAERLGIRVTRQEIRRAIMAHPNLQVQGEFIGLEQYKRILAANGIPIENFEDDIRYAELSKKLSRIITDSLDISDRELREEFSRMHQTTTVDYVLLEKDRFKERITPTEEALRTYFEENKEKYRIKEKRRATYLLIPTSQILPDIQVSEEEIRDEWARNPVPETVEAAHILFRVEDPSEEAEVRARAEAVLEQAKAGKDFAALAKQYSDDTGTADQGGYLGPIQRGQMGVREFEEAAFSLEPGQISGLVRTRNFGFHIIKVFRHDKPTLESNLDSLRTRIQLRKAKEAAREKAEKASELAAKGEDFTSIAGEMDIKAEVKETGLFDRDDNPFSLGISQALQDDIFQIKEVGAIGNVVQHSLGYACAKLEEIQMAKPGRFEESREQVKKDFINAESRERMEAEAEKLSEYASEQGNLADAAKKTGYSLKTSRDFKVDESPGPEIENRDDFNTIAFELEPGDVSLPIPMTDAIAVLQVKSRSPFDETAFEKEKNELHDRLLTSLKESYLQDYIRSFMEKLEESGKIRINPQVFEQAERI